MISVEHQKFSIKTKHPFGTAHGIRHETPAILIRVHYKSEIGYGEASIPPYYPESQESVIDFIKHLNLEQFAGDVPLDKLLNHIHTKKQNFAAKNAIDCALHDAWAKSKNKSLQEILIGPTSANQQYSSFTIGLDQLDVMLNKCREASAFKTLKIKLDGIDDIEKITAIRAISDQELMVDANQSWSTVKDAIIKSKKLYSLGVTLIEQPFKTGEWQKNKLLKEEAPVPIFADEDIQGIEDLEIAAESYDGINIKLMKCGGISQALKLIRQARDLNLKIMIGCMTETSCGISASCQLAVLADYLDLDGNLLLSNDPYQTTTSSGGIISVDTSHPGIGLIDDSTLWK